MPNIVNQSFFIGDILLPNLSHQAELERLTIFINKYEPQCLLQILGYPLYKLFGSESSTRMTELLNGAEYTDGEGQTRKFFGLKHDTVYSLIAYYVYFYYEQYQASVTTGTSTSVQKPEAGVAISPREKMANAWNMFSVETFELAHFLWMKKDIVGIRVYPEFTYHQYLETRRISRKMDSVFSL